MGVNAQRYIAARAPGGAKAVQSVQAPKPAGGAGSLKPVTIKPATGDKSAGEKINVGAQKAAPITNTVERDPYVADIQGKIGKYVEGTPEYAGALTEKALGGIRDSYEGVTKGIDASVAARGIGGTGAHGLLLGRSGDDQRRALSSAAKDISLGQHANVGQMLGTAGSLALGAQTGLQNQQRIGLDTRALVNQENQQGFDQLRALSGIYSEQQPSSFYEDKVTEKDAEDIRDAQDGATTGG